MATAQTKFSNRLFSKNNFPLSRQHLFLLRLLRLIESGYPLQRALEIIQWDIKLAETARHISIAIHQGRTIDEALEKAGFDKTIVAYFCFARMNGNLKATIKQCCLMLERQMKHVKKFKQTTRYPLFLLTLFVILLFFVKDYVYPSFLSLFASAGQSSSFVHVTVFFFELLFNSIVFFVCFALLLLPLWLAGRQRLQVEKQISIYGRIPLYRSYLRLQITFLFSLHLSALLETGMPLQESLRIINREKRLPIVAYYCGRIKEELEKGIHFRELAPSLILFEPGITDVFHQNTNTKVLQKDLSIYAEFLTEQIESKIKKELALIQPVVFLLLAGMIIFIYLSLMLPMFQLIDTI